MFAHLTPDLSAEFAVWFGLAFAVGVGVGRATVGRLFRR